MSQPKLIAELDRVTAKTNQADPADQPALALLVERRAEVVAQLTASCEPLDEHARSAMERARTAGDQLMERLRVLRASRRDELGRLHYSGCLLRALSAEIRPAPHIDYRG